MPFLASGLIGTQAEKTQQFIDNLTDVTDVKVATVDERLSTVEARKRLQESPGRTNRIKTVSYTHLRAHETEADLV